MPNALQSQLESIFDPKEFNIAKEFIIDSISRTNAQIIKITPVSYNNVNCVTFAINDTSIYVELLDRCNNNSGTNLLKLVEQFSKTIPKIEYIELVDKSKITTSCGFSVDLAVLKILTTGMSWYNSLGYISDDYENELRANSIIMRTNFKDAVNHAIEIKITNFKLMNTQPNIKRIVERYKAILSRLTSPPNYAESEMGLRRLTNLKADISKLESRIDSQDSYNNFIESNINSIYLEREKILKQTTELFSQSDDTLNVQESLSFMLKDMGPRFDNPQSCEKYKYLQELLMLFNYLLTYNRYHLKKRISTLVNAGVLGGGGKSKTKNRRKLRRRRQKKSRRNRKH